MNENSDTQLSSISKGRTLEEIAEYWDTHSLADHWEQTQEVEFEVRAPRRITIDPHLYKRLVAEARTRGVSPETLVNSWLNEHLLNKAA